MMSQDATNGTSSQVFPLEQKVFISVVTDMTSMKASSTVKGNEEVQENH